jgi:hypothetical protein
VESDGSLTENIWAFAGLSRYEDLAWYNVRVSTLCMDRTSLDGLLKGQPLSGPQFSQM